MKYGYGLGTVLAVVAAVGVAAQNSEKGPVSYRVSFGNAAHHEAQISITLRDVGTAPLELRMSRSSPGRYAIHEFAKNVYVVSAKAENGDALKITRTDPYSWIVDGHNGQPVTVDYTLYGDRADGTYAQIDLTHAHLNMPATFMWAKGFEDRVVNVEFIPADPSWKVATQLRSTNDPYIFEAPDFQYFMDSPTELSNFDLRTWQVQDGNATRTMRLAVHHEGARADMDTFTEKAKAVVAEQIKLFQDVPDFDFNTYTFIADYLSHVSGDGMEHRNSTILTNSRSLAAANFSQLGTLSHEFFHAWNVERLRPRELEPFNFEHTNPTPSLWLAEGFTSYYGPLTIRRARQSTLDEYLSDLSQQLSGIVNAPGRAFASPQEMSLRAPFVDAATSIDPTNNRNIFTSYYPYGAIIGLALDLSIRDQFEGKSLDDVMRRLWATNGRPEVPYAPDALQDAIADVTGNAAFAGEFFSNYVEHSDLPDFAPLLEKAGLILKLKQQGKAYLGSVSLNDEGEIRSNTVVGSPLYTAGLERGDKILKLGGMNISSQADLLAAVERFAPGETLKVVYLQRGIGKTVDIRLAADPALEIVPVEDTDRKISKKQQRFRDNWLGTVEK